MSESKTFRMHFSTQAVMKRLDELTMANTVENGLAVAKTADCDFCRMAGESRRAVVDGQTRSGRWGDMCRSHFEEHGVGLGVGLGQVLLAPEQAKRRRWPKMKCIACGSSAFYESGDGLVSCDKCFVEAEVAEVAVDSQAAPVYSRWFEQNGDHIVYRRGQSYIFSIRSDIAPKDEAHRVEREFSEYAFILDTEPNELHSRDEWIAELRK